MSIRLFEPPTGEGGLVVASGYKRHMTCVNPIIKQIYKRPISKD